MTQLQTNPKTHTIGIDTGGTFTDAVLIDGKGKTTAAKSLTTPHDLTEGLLNSLESLAEARGTDLEGLLQQTNLVRFSGTTALNAVVTRGGAKIGMLTTRGFEDTTLIGRALSAWTGSNEQEIRRAYRQEKPEPLIPVSLIRGVRGRIDWSGRELVPLAVAEVEDAVDDLIGMGVEAIAVCLLWSVRSGEHERLVRELVAGRVPVHLSHEVASTIGEYERFMTTIIDAYVGPVLTDFIDELAAKLASRGFDGQLLIAKSDGGGLYAQETQPVYTLGSGVAGGIISTAHEGRNLGLDNIITTDVGGTSFDVGVVAGGSWIYTREPHLGKFSLSIPMIEVESIGAGGGSIAWLDEVGVLHVGPQSAGAAPGPAAYGAGGVEPTVTDADVVLGYLNPENFLGGRMALHPELAEEAVAKVAEPLNLSIVEAAAGIFKIANSHMASLIARRVVARGYDPRDFSVFAFGGAGGAHCAYYAAEAGSKEVIVPALAGTFSALGVATAPLLHSAHRGDFTPMPATGEAFNQRFSELEAEVVARLDRDNVPAAERRIEYSLEMRYRSQVHTVRLEIERKTYDDDDVASVCTLFDEAYERIYGRGSAFPDAGSAVTSYVVEGFGSLPVPARQTGSPDGSLSLADPDLERSCYFDGDFMPTHVYRSESLRPGSSLRVPALVEAPQTTIVIPPDREAVVDEALNVRIK